VVVERAHRRAREDLTTPSRCIGNTAQEERRALVTVENALATLGGDGDALDAIYEPIIADRELVPVDGHIARALDPSLARADDGFPG